MNGGTILDLHFEPPLRPSKAKPDLAPFRLIQFKNASPAKKKKHGEAETGRGVQSEYVELCTAGTSEGE
jgi:hypothetical protein